MKILFKVFLAVIVGFPIILYAGNFSIDSAANGANDKMDITIELKSGKALRLNYIGDFETLFESDEKLLHYPRKILLIGPNIYILNSQSNEILVFDADYKYLKTIGRKGAGPAEFTIPLGMTLDKKGKRLFVTDSQLLRVQCFDLEGNFLSSFKTPPLIPDNVFYYDNRLYLTAMANMGADHAITIFDTSGNKQGKLFKLPGNLHYMERAVYTVRGLVFKDFFIYGYQSKDNRIYRYNLKTGKNQILGKLAINFKIPEIKFKENRLIGYIKMISDIKMIEEYGLLLCTYGGGWDHELIKKHNWVNKLDVFSYNGENLATCNLDDLEEDKAFGYKITVDENNKKIYLLSPEACQIYVYKYSYK